MSLFTAVQLVVSDDQGDKIMCAVIAFILLPGALMKMQRKD